MAEEKLLVKRDGEFCYPIYAKEKGGMIWKSSSFGIFWRQRGMKI